MLQVKIKVILSIKYLQTAYISHHGVDYKCHFSNTSTCAPYRQVPVEVYRGGPSLYGNWPTYIFAAKENVNVSLFLPDVTCYFLCSLCTSD